MAKIDLKKAPCSGRRKLSALGIELPLFPTTSAGSLPKHPELLELRYKVSKGVQQPSELERKERLSTEVWVREQERLGMDVLVDGEMGRGDLVQFFARKINGFAVAGTVRSYGNRYYKKPVIREKISWKEPLIVEAWRNVQRMTHRPVKAVLTGPYTLMDWSFDEFYPSREAALADLTAVIKKEILALVDAGAKIIQIDEPALSARPHEFSLVLNSLKELTGQLRPYFMLHHCYGDLAPIWHQIDKLPVDGLSLEMANSEYTILPLLKKFPTSKDLCLGIIDSHSHLVESPKQIAERIRKLRAVVPPAQLWLSPDCGLKTRTVEEASGKLKALVQGAAKARAS